MAPGGELKEGEGGPAAVRDLVQGVHQLRVDDAWELLVAVYPAGGSLVRLETADGQLLLVDARLELVVRAAAGERDS